MELITILNRCHRFKGFVYQHAYFSADKKCIEVAVRPRKGLLLSELIVGHPSPTFCGSSDGFCPDALGKWCAPPARLSQILDAPSARRASPSARRRSRRRTTDGWRRNGRRARSACQPADGSNPVHFRYIGLRQYGGFCVNGGIFPAREFIPGHELSDLCPQVLDGNSHGDAGIGLH